MFECNVWFKGVSFFVNSLGGLKTDIQITKTMDINSSTRHHCMEGFISEDKNTIVCGENGQWSGEKPRCIKKQNWRSPNSQF